MKRVFLCADGETDVRTLFRHLLSSGAAPAAPLMYALMLEPGSEEAHAQMTRAGESLLWLCDEVWVVGEPTPDMARQIRMAGLLNLPVRQLKQSEIRRMEEDLNE